MNWKQITICIAIIILAGCITPARIDPQAGGERNRTQNRTRQESGRDSINNTVNFFGTDTVICLAGVCGLLAFGWTAAGRDRGRKFNALRDVVRGNDMFKALVGRDSPQADAVKKVFKHAQDFHQATGTRKMVERIRGKAKKTTC